MATVTFSLMQHFHAIWEMGVFGERDFSGFFIQVGGFSSFKTGNPGGLPGLGQKLGVNYHVAQAGFRDYIDARCDSRDIPVKLRELSLGHWLSKLSRLHLLTQKEVSAP